MAQYPRVPMPEIKIDPMGSILDLMRLSQMGEQQVRQRKEDARRDSDQARQDETYAQEKADRAAIDRVGSPQFAQEIATNMPGWQGPIDPSNPPPRPTDDQIVNALPAHLRPIVQKQFRDAAEEGRKAQTSILGLQEAQRKAAADVNEHLAGIGYSIAQWGYAPEAVQWAFDHAKVTYAKSPDILSEIDIAEQAISQDPTHVKTVVADLVSKSPRYLGLLQKEGATTEIELATIAATDPDPEKKANAQRVLNALEKHRQNSAVPHVPSLQERLGNPETRAQALKDEADLARARHVDDGKGDENRVYTRDRQDYANFRSDWAKEHPSGPVKDAAGRPVFDANDQPVKRPFVKPPTFEVWRAGGKKGPAPVVPIVVPEERQYTRGVKVTEASGETPPAGRGVVPSTGRGAAPPVSTSTSSEPFWLTVDGRDVKFASRAQADAWAKKHRLTLK